MAAFNFYLKDIMSENRPYFSENGFGSFAGKAVNLLKTYLQPVIEKSGFDSVNVLTCPDNWTPAMQDTDVIVYVLRDVGESVIAANGGTAAMAVADTNLLGLTDLNSKICEIYFDRMYAGNPKLVAGAAYHEAAHVKSNMDNAMHKNQDGFLKAAPDYYGSPSTKNTAFFKSHLARKVNMRSGL
ncbi:MAG: hypothetical protein ACRD6X_10950 [Pyrinomonadaceae bacterium]